MKLIWHVSHLNNFHIPKNEGGKERVGMGQIKKTIKKSCEINKN